MLKNQVERSSAPTSGVMIARLAVVLAAGLFLVGKGYGQTLIAESGRLRQTDLAVLERREPRNDLRCSVSRTKPELDWDFTFHTSYDVDVPLRGLVGHGNELTVLFRVAPQDHPDDPVYMGQKIRVPVIEEGSKGEFTFNGAFVLGEGEYHVDWLMRDRQEHICAMSWNVDTKLKEKDSQLRPWVPQAQVQPSRQLFADEPTVIRAPKVGLPRVSIIVIVDPPDPIAAQLDDRDLEGLVSILRRIANDPHIEMHSIIACSLAKQQVFYREKNPGVIHFWALGEALSSLKFGIVDAKRLASTSGPAQFAVDLIRGHLKKENPDALVVLGRKGDWDTKIFPRNIKPFERPSTPTFYLSYSAEQPYIVSRDPIRTVIKSLHGFEYGIRRPRDFFNAWSDVVARIVVTKPAAQGPIAANSRTP